MYSEFKKTHTHTHLEISQVSSVPVENQILKDLLGQLEDQAGGTGSIPDLAQDDKSLASGLSLVSCHLPPTPFPEYRSCVSPLNYVNYCGRC